MYVYTRWGEIYRMRKEVRRSMLQWSRIEEGEKGRGKRGRERERELLGIHFILY